jgi:hypothetical protein
VAAPLTAGGRDGFLSDVIVELGFATPETVEQAVRAARSPGTTVARVLLDMNAISEEQLAQAIAERYGIDYIDLEGFEVDPAAANLIDAGLARRYRAVPVAFLGDRVLVAMADPADVVGVNDMAVVIQLQVRPAVASRPALDALLEALPLELQDGTAEEPAALEPPAPKSPEASELRSELDALKRQLAGAQAKLRGQAAPAGSEAAETPAVAELQARLAEAEAELEAARDRVREAKEVSAELETLREALAAAEAGLTARALAGGAASGATRELQARPAQARERVDTGRVERDEARERAGDVEAELRRIRAEVEVRSGELTLLRRQLSDAEVELVRVRAEVDARGSELAAMRIRAESAEAEAESALRRASEAEREWALARRDAEEAQRLAERDFCQTLGVEKIRRVELEERLSDVEGSAVAAERAFEELRLAQGRMREALRSLAEPEPAD